MASETGRQRSQRIEIDYYRRTTGLHTLRKLCGLAGLVGAGGYAFYVLAAGGGSHTSTGPLTVAHASFENDCGQCHQNLTPIDPQAARLDWKLVGVDSKTSLSRIEAACQKCHQVGDHYRDVMNADWQLQDQNCAACHADHQGRVHDLTAVAAQKCTACHADLAAGCQGTPRVRANVTAFDKDGHGDFASLGEGDPGTVKFDHHQHLQPGQVDDGGKGAFTLAMLDQSLRERYRRDGQQDSSPVQLDCSSCHSLDGNPAGADTLVSDAELGRYLQPISFEQHCAACHAMHPGAATADTTPLPHAVPWNKIDLLLSASIAGARQSGQARMPRDDTQPTPLAGDGSGNPPPAAASPLASDGEIAAARKLVETQCLKCHDDTSIADEAIRNGLAATASPMIPARWLVHGLYDHGAHRQIDCRYCHSAAYPVDGSAKPPTDDETVMIDGIESCTGCHRDAESAPPATLTSDAALLGGQPTWASDQCTLCHRYHTPHVNLTETAP
jgi:hypothetical protein